MPSELTVGGTTRVFTLEAQEFLDRRIEELAHSLATEHVATADVKLWRTSPPLINPAEQTKIAVEAARAVVGIENVITNGKRVNAGEDFAFMLEARRVHSSFSAMGLPRTAVSTRFIHRSTISTMRSYRQGLLTG
jgi:hippurate hydrolase